MRGRRGRLLGTVALVTLSACLGIAAFARPSSGAEGDEGSSPEVRMGTLLEVVEGGDRSSETLWELATLARHYELSGEIVRRLEDERERYPRDLHVAEALYHALDKAGWYERAALSASGIWDAACGGEFESRCEPTYDRYLRSVVLRLEAVARFEALCHPNAPCEAVAEVEPLIKKSIELADQIDFSFGRSDEHNQISLYGERHQALVSRGAYIWMLLEAGQLDKAVELSREWEALCQKIYSPEGCERAIGMNRAYLQTFGIDFGPQTSEDGAE